MPALHFRPVVAVAGLRPPLRHRSCRHRVFVQSPERRFVPSFPDRSMTSILVQPVVMAGGGGTRLWPLSRAGFPKQFLALGGKETLFQAAVERLQGLAHSGFT